MAKLTRDQRLIVRSQHACGDSMKTIAKRNGFSRSQVRYACRDDVNSTPQKDKSGRPPKLPIHGLDNVRSWIGESPERRFEKKGYGNNFRRANPLDKYTPK
ncbi:transposable element tc3 transposase [Penicillium citrinum]|uniref:Transposable element tc3 transposase n=1 Tax=Penicillium citrinum TaxID=5077 RepID=A0A9W9NII1_PENCI|nr:transposable element tc3 transposase [Penicillium citrinum]KAJ5220632.1 transposable element tc3 transposase [Penicillium citrinum]